MDHVCFVYRALVFLMDSAKKPCAEHHELTVGFFKHIKCLQYPWNYATYYMENYMNDEENDEQI